MTCEQDLKPGAPITKAAKSAKRPTMTPTEQRAEIERVARDYGPDERVDAAIVGSAARVRASKDVVSKTKETIKSARARIAADTRTQAEKFEAAAREHGTDQDEEAFKGVLRKLGKAKR